jgi:hypothetical protein
MANATEINSQNPNPVRSAINLSTATPLKIDDKNNKGLIGTGLQKTPLTFDSGQVTKFNLPLMVNYKPDPKYGLYDDPTMNELLQLCVAPAPGRRTKIYYEATLEIKAISWSPFKPKITGEIPINCPLDRAAVAELQDSMKKQGTGTKRHLALDEL